VSAAPVRGILLFAHGARDPRWAEPFDEVARRVARAEPATAVRLAFLEFMTPTLREAGDALAAAGCTRVDVVPLFLGAGGHVRKDLPLLLDELGAAHPGVLWRLQRAIGQADAVIEAMAIAALALASAPNPTLTTPTAPTA
jgi:sirohydrochlorin cobaltochelatase